MKREVALFHSAGNMGIRQLKFFTALCIPPMTMKELGIALGLMNKC